MTTLALKKKITNALLQVDDEEFLQGIYTIINNKVGHNDCEYSDALKVELNENSALYKSGKLKSYTVVEVGEKIKRNNNNFEK